MAYTPSNACFRRHTTRNAPCNRKVARLCQTYSPTSKKQPETETARIAASRKSGGGGGRTRVQTRNPRAFYMFSQPFNPSTRTRQVAAKYESQPLNLAR